MANKSAPIEIARQVEPAHGAHHGNASSPAAQVDIRQAAGNLAVQRLLRGGGIQARLAVGQPGDVFEQEADRLAEQLTSGDAAFCLVPTGCTGPEPSDLLQRKRSPRTAAPSREAVASSLPPLGTGRPIDPGPRAFFEARLGQDLSQVRVHTGPQAAMAARLLNARAFASGSDVGFAQGEYAPHTTGGHELLAHELIHVIQQDSVHGSAIQRWVGGDITQMSIGPEFAEALTDDELLEQAQLVWQHLSSLSSGSPEYEAALANLNVLAETQAQRTAMSGVAAEPVFDTVSRPPGLPTDEGFVLQPLSGMTPELAANLPEGQMLSLTIVPMGAEVSPEGEPGVQPTTITTPLASGSAAMIGSINEALRTTGFAAAGENAIGIVGVPRWFTPGARVPESLAMWGHTAAYARVGGRIVAVRDFLPASMVDTLLHASAIEGGMRGTPAAIGSDVALFTRTGAMSIEYPVSRSVALSFLEGLPEPGPVGPLEPALYTARPAIQCIGSNCVLWAVGRAESALGGPIGPRSPGVSVTALGEGGGLVEGTASQGRLFRFMGQVAESPGEAAAVARATGPPVARGMATGLRVLKWGGRVFIVIGIASVPAEVALAPEGERARTAVGATGGLVAGFAMGATAGLVCGPGAPVCSLILGVAFGAAGAFAGRSFAEGLYDEIQQIREAAAWARAESPGSFYAPPGTVTLHGFRGGYGAMLRSPLDVVREMQAERR